MAFSYLKKLASLICFIGFLQNTLYSQTITGQLKQYHKTTLTFEGLNLSEKPATYLDYRMNVTFTSPSSAVYIIPGYFAADGHAAETSATSGNKWRCHFTPNEIGTWNYSVSFRSGINVAVSTNPLDGKATSIDGNSGMFEIIATDIKDNDFRAKGKLQYVGKDFAQFDNGDYYFEIGADSPETFLEYDDFDATPSRHDYEEVANNYSNGDPSWQNGKGTEIIGAVNYLANQGLNIHYFLTMNITGDGDRAYPFPNKTDYTTYDVSKLDQWQIVFDHMYNKGMAQELVLTETENSNWFEDQEGISRQTFSNSRKLYYREMIARFGYLNIIYNLGEEANWDSGGDEYEATHIEEAANYIKSLSPYNDLISVHNGPSKDFSIFPELTALPGKSALTTISLQANFQTITHGHNELLNVKNLSTKNNKEWVVRYSEPYSSKLPNIETWTNNSLWASITAGSAGIHYYSHNGDIKTDDYRLHEKYYERMRYAKAFLENNNIPFQNLESNNAAVSSGYLLTDFKDHYIIFLPNGGSTAIDILSSGNFDLKWFDPRHGGALKNGNITKVSNGIGVAIGEAPNSITSSWVVLLKRIKTE
ncbi:DUF5060 domain-containing protein [Algibacter sp. R77976]|uniref:DUF5060 domain-containing protein n=1 Tax=Algibacter sp. R77976 TaxID=3093873 RepID=UPI0037CA516F